MGHNRYPGRQQPFRHVRTLAAVVLSLGLTLTGVGLALAGGGGLPQKEVWPVAGQVLTSEQHQYDIKYDTYEFIAYSWEDWLLVHIDGGGPSGSVNLDATRLRDGKVSRTTLKMQAPTKPLAALRQAQAAEFVPHSKDEPLQLPGLRMLLGVRDLESPGVTVLDTAPGHRREVAQRLGVSEAALDDARVDVMESAEPVSMVWLRDAGIMLLSDETGLRTEVTYLRLGFADAH
jgi:hypothetical protein